MAFLLLLVIASCGAPAFEAKTVQHGQLYEKSGVWVMELDGTPAERGAAAGQLLGEQIRWGIPRYLKDTLYSEKPIGHPLAILRKLEPSIPKPYLDQLDALAKSAKIDRDSLLLVNLAPEAWAGLACSCMAATDAKSSKGTPLLARNLDWFGGDVLEDLGLVVVERGNGHTFASLTYPGLVGAVTGMNAHGVAAANLVVLGQKAQPTPGLPVTFAVRRILEEAKNLEEAVQILESADRTVPQNYALADEATAVVLETWQQRFRRRNPSGGFVAVGNLFDEDKGTHPNGRYPKMMRAGAAPSLGVAELEAALLEVSMEDMTVHSAILDPANRTLRASTTSRPAAAGPFWELDLRPLLGAPEK